ncbi:fasciclin domain-containing protein [Labilibaculum sp.]|uniref:fasciclin domain-containing protein n=1 Tax=Labilibaculum sp. TaxID=2060723 RepID=UPI003566AF8A
MKYIYNYKLVYSLIASIALVFATVSCDDEVSDEHFNQIDIALEQNLKSLIAEDAELSTFYSLLQQTGYDTLLTYTQAYTVWAPTNDALATVSDDILNDADALYQLIGNHISRYSYTSSDIASEDILVKMFNDKYVENSMVDGTVYFDEAEVIEGDNLSSNGILHKIGDVVSVKSNIWNYLSEADGFSTLVDYISQYESIVFDADVSTIIGQNSLGKNVYDSVFISTNSYFDLVGDLNNEEERHSYIALSDDVYAVAYDSFKDYYQHPVEDSTITNVNATLFNNLNFDELSNDQLGTTVCNTLGNCGIINTGSVDESIRLSNGNILAVNNFDLTPEDLVYKPIRYEVENSARRTVGDAVALTIKKDYDITASGLFTNKIQLDENPDDKETNNYFEVEFSYVLSADYDVYIKFSPIGASKDTKLKFEFSYTDADAKTVTNEIESIVIGNEENSSMKIGSTYTNPVYVNDNSDNKYIVKLKVFVDVSEAELVLYDRVFGIDYIELVPAE